MINPAHPCKAANGLAVGLHGLGRRLDMGRARPYNPRVKWYFKMVRFKADE